MSKNYRRLGKLRISKRGHNTIMIDPTNIQQFTATWENDSSWIIDIESQILNRNDGKTFARFRKDAENVWKVCCVQSY